MSLETTVRSSMLGSVPSLKSFTTLSSEAGNEKAVEEEMFPLIDLSEPSEPAQSATPPLSVASSTDESSHDQDKLDIPEFPLAPPPSIGDTGADKGGPQISEEQWEALWEKLESELALDV